jgi:hypothetical protein
MADLILDRQILPDVVKKGFEAGALSHCSRAAAIWLPAHSRRDAALRKLARLSQKTNGLPLQKTVSSCPLTPRIADFTRMSVVRKSGNKSPT